MVIKTMIVLAGLAACGVVAADDATARREFEAWHAKRIERLKGESGWLTLVGLHWLKAGENRFGSDPSNTVALPAGKAPPVAGVFLLDGKTVRVKAAPEVNVTLRGARVDEQVLNSDMTENPDVLKLGDLSMVVIQRGDRFGIRVKDPTSPVRKNFKGIEMFPFDPRFRVEAEWVAYESPRTVEIPTVVGTVDTMTAPGFVRFTLNGVPCTLEPVVEDPNDPSLWFIYKDRTSGKETYPAGRFLYADMPKDGKVTIDFNKSYNPPCAFTPYATCPLPPKKNWLAVPVEAGEKAFKHAE